MTLTTRVRPASPAVPEVDFTDGNRGRRYLLDALLLGAACGAGALAAAWPLAAVAACVLSLLAALVWVRPATAAYLLVGVTPLVAGIDRGELIPFFRPNEALALFLGATLAARWVFGLRSGAVRWVRPGAVDVAVVLMAVTNSISPLLTMAVRGREITADDLLYSLVLWKLVGVYLIVKIAVRTAREVQVCLVISVAVACVVAGIGIVQGLDLFGVRDFLAEYYAPFGSSSAIQARPRGGSTLSLPAAAADFLIMNLAVATGLWLRGRRFTVLFGGVVAVLIAGTLAAGEFSSTLGLVLGLVTLAVVAGSLGLLGFFAVLLIGGGLAVWPVIAERLQGFAHASGIPPSWVGRLMNLKTYFWPDLSAHGNFLLGVRPSARVPVPTQVTGYVWIESGYAWLLWGGGIPLLLSFLFFVWAAGTRGWHVARTRPDAVGAAGTGAVVAVVLITVLMVFDPHLTYRGSADAAFALIALTTAAVPLRRIGSAEQHRPQHRANG
jgi:hypothetical protein